ncbi:MAG: CARDB domain-containing protein [Gemmatimonadota bacterium]
MTRRHVLALALALLPLFFAGCDELPVTAGAAGSSIDVEYIAPDRFDDVAAEPILVYPAKFVCGEAGSDSWHTPGSYRTVINVANLSAFQVTVQWRFASLGHAFEGASARIPSHGTMVLDCDFILDQFASANADLSDVLEGFVVLEDLESTRAIRVAVVYTTLHKQLHDRPDLIPVSTADRFCDLDDQRRLRVTIRNQGERRADPSTTRLELRGVTTRDLATPALDPGQQAQLEPVALPRGEGTFRFRIDADVAGFVAESNELNNRARGSCLIIE